MNVYDFAAIVEAKRAAIATQPPTACHTHAVELPYINESRRQLLGGRCDGILDRKDLP